MGRGALLGPVLLLAGCAAVEEAAPAPPPSRPAAEAVLARLPERAAGFERGATLPVAAGEPGAGVVVEYATPGRVAVAHVFLYDLGRARVGEADLPPEVERAAAEAAVLPAGSPLAETGRETMPAPGGALRCAGLAGRFGRGPAGRPVERRVCVGTAEGRFLRVQVTMPRGAGADAPGLVRAVAAAVRGA